eukprot:SAG11_NODE_7075_length_1198_cov_1.496815_1_plen_156_part_00
MKLAPQWAKLMLPSGYDTVTIDEFWYPNDGESASALDAHGECMPASACVWNVSCLLREFARFSSSSSSLRRSRSRRREEMAVCSRRERFHRSCNEGPRTGLEAGHPRHARHPEGRNEQYGRLHRAWQWRDGGLPLRRDVVPVEQRMGKVRIFPGH